MDFNERKKILENTRDGLKSYFNEINLKLSDNQINNLSSQSYKYFVDDKEINDKSGPLTNRMTFTHSGGLGGGKTYKPKNILLNWTKLAEVAIGTALGGLPVPGWTLYLAGLLLIKNFTDIVTVNIEERQSMILWAMHSKLGRNNLKKSDDLLPIINNELVMNNRSPINLTELNISLSELKKLCCVKCNENDEWSLVEQIYVN